MSQDRQPTCWIIAGPNGAGKTTFALDYLPRIAGHQTFVNADLIASGIEPLAPENRRLEAGRVFLREIRKNIEAERDFAFEATLAGRVHRRLIARMKSEGWRVEIVYLALPSVEMARSRVAERVRQGGHDIPPADIQRRFFRSLSNFLNDYAFLANHSMCYFNGGASPVLVFAQQGARRIVMEPVILSALERLNDRNRHGYAK